MSLSYGELEEAAARFGSSGGVNGTYFRQYSVRFHMDDWSQDRDQNVNTAYSDGIYASDDLLSYTSLSICLLMASIILVVVLKFAMTTTSIKGPDGRNNQKLVDACEYK